MPHPDMIEPDDWSIHRDIPRPRGWIGKVFFSFFCVVSMAVLGYIFWPLIDILVQWFMA